MENEIPDAIDSRWHRLRDYARRGQQRTHGVVDPDPIRHAFTLGYHSAMQTIGEWMDELAPASTAQNEEVG